MPELITTTKPGKKYRSLKRPRVYEALRKHGYSKQSAARISNAQARTKSYTLAQLEAYVSSPAYTPQAAGLIALSIPALPRLKGEQLSPGITRIRGNLCNVHGKYGPCDKGLSGKKPKGKRQAKPKQTPAQRAAARDAERQQNRQTTLTAQGYSAADQAALAALRSGQQPTGAPSPALIDQGVVEQASDGSYRLTSSGRALLNASSQADAGRARDTVSSARDRLAARRQRQQDAAKRAQDAAGKRTAAATGRALAKREREQAQARRAAAAAKKPAKASGGGGKTSETQAGETPRRAAPKRVRRSSSSAPSVGSIGGGAKKKPAQPKMEKLTTPETPRATTPALQATAQRLSDGTELSTEDTQALIRNGLAKVDRDGNLVLTASGQRAIRQKETSFRVFKDARGQWRWVAQSSTAFQDRDQEIVSIKALAEDCAYADTAGWYGPLRWWHTPGLDLGDCDFNAMHGRVLIESGTFRSEAIATKVATAAPLLELSLGFLHLPSEPDADGVFHHIRRFERSLVPRGKASNRFTAFTVKEIPMLDATKVAALKTLGFSDDDITGLQAQAQATEKAADDQHIAYKAEEPAVDAPADLPDLVINGVTYKAVPPMLAEADATEKDDGVGDMAAMAEDAPVDEAVGGLTLSDEDLGAIAQTIGQAITQALAPLAGLLDMEKKMQGHVQTLMQPFQAQKEARDTADAERQQQIATLQAALKDTQGKLDELLGLQPAVQHRPSQDASTAVNPFMPTDAQLLRSVKEQLSPEQQFAFGDLVQNLFGNPTPGQA